MADHREIEVFADITCPFAHLSLRQFVARRAEEGADHVQLRVRSWPLELANGEALTADKVASEAEDIRAQVAPDLFGGFEPGAFPASTLVILGVCSAAYAKGLSTGEAFNLAVRDELFEHGRPIGDRGTLDRLALAHGFEAPDDEAARRIARTEFAEGKKRGVEGSPTFFVERQTYFCPAFDIGHEGEQLKVEFAREAADRFLSAAFA